MAYKTKAKTTSTVESMLNWSEISKFLTGGEDRIRKNRIPTVHQKKIEELFLLLQRWKAGTKMFTEVELRDALGKIDTKTILLVEMGILDRDENHFSGK